MQRYYKFRAWDNNEGRMIHMKELEERSGYMEHVEEYINPFKHISGSAFDKDFSFMLFLDLYDCEGKEVYDGDILVDDKGVPYLATLKEVGKIRYYNDNKDQIVNLKDIIKDGNELKLKVIGNMHQEDEMNLYQIDDLDELITKEEVYDIMFDLFFDHLDEHESDIMLIVDQALLEGIRDTSIMHDWITQELELE